MYVIDGQHLERDRETKGEKKISEEEHGQLKDLQRRNSAGTLIKTFPFFKVHSPYQTCLTKMKIPLKTSLHATCNTMIFQSCDRPMNCPGCTPPLPSVSTGSQDMFICSFTRVGLYVSHLLLEPISHNFQLVSDFFVQF